MLESIFYGTFLDRNRLTLARIGYLLLIWIVIPLFLLVRLTTMLLGMIFSAGLSAYFEESDVSFNSPFLTWTGDVGLHNLRIQPKGEGAAARALLARRVLIDLPNLGALETFAAYDNSDDDSEEITAADIAFLDKIDKVGLSIEGLEANFQGDLPSILRNFGLASAAPFEAEGCQRDDHWSGAELSGMGIQNQGVDLGFTFDTDDQTHEVRLHGQLDSPRSSRVAFTQHFRARNLSSYLLGTEKDRISTYERVEITDAGFTAARDAFCAKRDGVSPEVFTERHIAAIQRRLQARGMRASTEIERAYRAYRSNGSLLIEARPSPNVRRTDYHLYAFDDQQRMYNGMISSGNLEPVPLAMDATRSKPVPLNFEGSSWDLVAMETGGPTPLTLSAATAERPAAAVAPMDERLAMAAPSLISASVAATPRTPVAMPVPAPVAAAPVPVAVPVAAKTAPTPSAAAPRKWASSLPTATKRHEIKTLTYDDLAQHVGERILITTNPFGDVRDVIIESYSKQELLVRARVVGGYATQHIARGQVRSVRDPD
jgi:hypothetical protein